MQENIEKSGKGKENRGADQIGLKTSTEQSTRLFFINYLALVKENNRNFKKYEEKK